MHEDPPPINKTLPRWPGVDVLRGLSVVLVVLHHVHLRFRLRGFPVDELVPKPLARVLFWSGQPAVIVFFVISGFLITERTLARWGRLERVQVTAFYRMRAARILPCLLLLLAVLASLHGLGASDYVIPPERASLTRALVAALGFHINWLEGTRGYLPGAWDVLWSLSVEEAFYLAFPLVCLAARSERGVTLVLSLLLVIGPVTRVQIDGQVPWEDYAYLASADGLAFGCLTALYRARLQPIPGLLRGALLFGSLLILIVLCLRPQLHTLGLYNVGLAASLLQLAAALLLLGLTRGTAAERAPSGLQLLAAVGRASYEIYLTHMFVVFGAAQIALQLGAAAETLLLCYPLILAVCAGLGMAIARLYSEPANRRLRAATYSRAAAPKPRAA